MSNCKTRSWFPNIDTVFETNHSCNNIYTLVKLFCSSNSRQITMRQFLVLYSTPHISLPNHVLLHELWDAQIKCGTKNISNWKPRSLCHSWQCCLFVNAVLSFWNRNLDNISLIRNSFCVTTFLRNFINLSPPDWHCERIWCVCFIVEHQIFHFHHANTRQFDFMQKPNTTYKTAFNYTWFQRKFE